MLHCRLPHHLASHAINFFSMVFSYIYVHVKNTPTHISFGKTFRSNTHFSFLNHTYKYKRKSTHASTSVEPDKYIYPETERRRRRRRMRQAGAYSGIHSGGGISGRTGPHSLPLARIKKIMKKSGEDVKMISGEAPIVFSKACELFIEELTRRSWMVTLQGKRRTLHKDDIAAAVHQTDLFDFLVQMVFHPRPPPPPPPLPHHASVVIEEP